MAKAPRAAAAQTKPDPAPAPVPTPADGVASPAEAPSTPPAPAAPANFLQSLGMETEAGQAFWKPTGRIQVVTLLSGRAPRPAEKIKVLPEEYGGDEVTVLGIFAVQKDGAEMVWEVTSRRAMAALAQVVTSFPVTLAIQSKGEGKQTAYAVRLASEDERVKAAQPAPARQAEKAPDLPPPTQPLCDAPSCVLYAGHAGRHMTQREFAAQTAEQRAQQRLAPTPVA